MRKIAVAFGLVSLLAASPASAQLGRLGDLADKAQKVKKVADLKVTAAEERSIGQEVSDKIVNDFGVVQDAAVTKYVTLVGRVLADAGTRPELDWQFVVLDTDGVNAFAAPGGFVHITRGLLGLLKNEAELAGVLAHELIHATEKHTVNAIQKGDTVKLVGNEAGSGGLTQNLISQIAQKAYSDVINNNFNRSDENEADDKGAQLANKVGYAASGLTTALNKLVDRNAGQQEPNGLFASHPQMKDRLANIDRVIRDRKLTATATGQERYAKTITYTAKPTTEVATVAEGSRGLTGGGGEKKSADTKEAKKEEPKSGGGLLSRLGGGGAQKPQTGTVASAGGRGLNPDRDAAGGPNKKRLIITISPAEIAEFRKGIA